MGDWIAYREGGVEHRVNLCSVRSFEWDSAKKTLTIVFPNETREIKLAEGERVWCALQKAIGCKAPKAPAGKKDDKKTGGRKKK